MPNSFLQRLVQLESLANKPTPPAPEPGIDHAEYAASFHRLRDDWEANGKPVVTETPLLELLTATLWK